MFLAPNIQSLFTEYGLSSAIFTGNLEQGRELELQVESGMGGVGNKWIVDEFTVTKWISVQTEYQNILFEQDSLSVLFLYSIM
jgi:hypothetical protein